jgi:uncharacterized protein YbjT (DUF2867 family)
MMADAKPSDLKPPRRNILVTGATGKQGTALIQALLHPIAPNTDHQFHIYALTRSTSNPRSAHLLSSNPATNITLVEGDLDVPSSISAIFEDAKNSGGGGIWGVFAVLAYPGLGADADGEERQGRLLADLALRYGVEVFVYSSAARPGPKYEPQLTLSQAAKRDVEVYCKELGQKGLNWR